MNQQPTDPDEALAKVRRGELITQAELVVLPDGTYGINEFTTVIREGSATRFQTKYLAWIVEVTDA